MLYFSDYLSRDFIEHLSLDFNSCKPRKNILEQV